MANGNMGINWGYQLNPSGTAATNTTTYSGQYGNNWNGTIPGTGANQFQVAYSDSGSLVGTSKTYTLSALPGVAGSTLVIATLKEVVIKNNAALGSGFGLIVEPGATHGCALLTGASGSFTVPPQGCYILSAPDAAGIGVVTVSSSDQLKIDAGANTIPYEVQFKGI